MIGSTVVSGEPHLGLLPALLPAPTATVVVLTVVAERAAASRA